MTDASLPLLVSTDWLAAHREDEDLCVLDCTVHLEIDRETGEIELESGRADWEESHIPGSRFADLLTDFSETEDPDYWLQRPGADQFARAIEALGVGDDSRVVVYDTTDTNIWAARMWWLLRAVGFDQAGVLDGGWSKWVREGRPVSDRHPEYETGSLTPEVRPEVFAAQEEVQASIDDGNRCLVNALRTEDHVGDGPQKYGRRGRIPSSVNVPAAWDHGVVDQETGTFRSREELRRMFARVGVTDRDRVITYCGGGISASCVAFALCLIGVENVAVYDGSLAEWGHDEALPMVSD